MAVPETSATIHRDLRGKVAIVTGGGSGIGLGIVNEFLRQGVRVVAADIEYEKARGALAEAPSDQLHVQKVDVSMEDEVEKLVQEAVRRFGGLDIMVNNAGIAWKSELVPDITTDNYLRYVGVNQNGCFFGIRSASRVMRDRGTAGVIINTASINGTMATKYAFSYCATKGAVVMMTKAAAVDLAKYNIRVVAIAPALVETPATVADYGRDSDRWKLMERAHMRRRAATPADIANVVAFLASSASGLINGHVVYVDDGCVSFR